MFILVRYAILGVTHRYQLNFHIHRKIGKVEIQTRKGQLVHILRHGDFFGEGSLLEENNKRFSSARCATPVDVIKIKRSDFDK